MEDLEDARTGHFNLPAPPPSHCPMVYVLYDHKHKLEVGGKAPALALWTGEVRRMRTYVTTVWEGAGRAGWSPSTGPRGSACSARGARQRAIARDFRVAPTDSLGDLLAIATTTVTRPSGVRALGAYRSRLASGTFTLASLGPSVRHRAEDERLLRGLLRVWHAA